MAGERTKALPVLITTLGNPLGGAGALIADAIPQRVSLLVRAIGVDPIYLGFDPQDGAQAGNARLFRLNPGDSWSPDEAFGTHQGQLWGWGSYVLAGGSGTPLSDGTVEVHQLVIDPSAPNPEATGLELPPEAPTIPAEPATPWNPFPTAPPRPGWHDPRSRL